MLIWQAWVTTHHPLCHLLRGISQSRRHFAAAYSFISLHGYDSIPFLILWSDFFKMMNRTLYNEDKNKGLWLVKIEENIIFNGIRGRSELPIGVGRMGQKHEQSTNNKWRRVCEHGEWAAPSLDFSPINSLDDGCLMYIFIFLSLILGLSFSPDLGAIF